MLCGIAIKNHSYSGEEDNPMMDCIGNRIHKVLAMRKRIQKLKKLQNEWYSSKEAFDASLKHPVLYAILAFTITAFIIPGAISAIVLQFIQSTHERETVTMAIFAIVALAFTIYLGKTRRGKLYHESNFCDWVSKQTIDIELLSYQSLHNAKRYTEKRIAAISALAGILVSVLASVYSSFIPFTFFDPVMQEEVITYDNLGFLIAFSLLLALACQAISFLTKAILELALSPSPAFTQALIGCITDESSTKTAMESIAEDQTPEL